VLPQNLTGQTKEKSKKVGLRTESVGSEYEAGMLTTHPKPINYIYITAQTMLLAVIK
jgi:hypothetical protein